MVSQELDDAGYALVVVDMQWGWEASREISLQKAVEREVLLAREAGMPIIFLEMRPIPFCHSYPVLTDHIAGYRWGAIMQKKKDDGSREALWKCKLMGRRPKTFRVCGVNSDACVLETVRGLRTNSPGCVCQIVTDACRSYSGWCDWNVVATWKDVELLNWA